MEKEKVKEYLLESDHVHYTKIIKTRELYNINMSEGNRINNVS